MTIIDSKTVEGRRKLTFASFDDLLADAEMLVASPSVKMHGNWQLDQLLMHVASAMNFSIDGMPMKRLWFSWFIGPSLKRRILKHGMSPGFRLPKAREAGAFPSASSPQAALDALRKAIGRLRTERATAVHPAFGKLTHDEWLRLHLRHAEMHLSFAVPATSATAAIRSGAGSAKVSS